MKHGWTSLNWPEARVGLIYIIQSSQGWVYSCFAIFLFRDIFSIYTIVIDLQFFRVVRLHINKVFDFILAIYGSSKMKSLVNCPLHWTFEKTLLPLKFSFLDQPIMEIFKKWAVAKNQKWQASLLECSKIHHNSYLGY